MMEKKLIAAYGNRKDAVDNLGRRDVVFYYHTGHGVVAAAQVLGPTRQDGSEEKYRDVEFLTPIPNRRDGIQKCMPSWQVSPITGNNYFWARIDKRPYLTTEEAETLLDELRNVLS